MAVKQALAAVQTPTSVEASSSLAGGVPMTFSPSLQSQAAALAVSGAGFPPMSASTAGAANQMQGRPNFVVPSFVSECGSGASAMNCFPHAVLHTSARAVLAITVLKIVPGIHLANRVSYIFLIAVDYYSGYFEVQDMSGTTSTRVITVLKSWFSRHGIPVIIISDNGPPFNSKDFKTFSKEWDFHQTISSPYHAQSNGRVVITDVTRVAQHTN